MVIHGGKCFLSMAQLLEGVAIWCKTFATMYLVQYLQKTRPNSILWLISNTVLH